MSKSFNHGVDVAYTADTMRVLEGLEPVRQNPSQYVGDTSAVSSEYCHGEEPDGVPLNAGGFHLFVETLANACDEATNYDVKGNPFATRIETVLNKDQSITVKDNGRGVPPDINKDTGLTGIEMCWLVMNAGGKFKSKDKSGKMAFGSASGLHGIGSVCTNALSDMLKVQVYRDGYVYELHCKRGVPGRFNDKGKFVASDGKSSVVTKSKDKRSKEEKKLFPHGTYVTWHPDGVIWGGTDIPLADVYRHVEAQSYMAPEATFIINDMINDKVTTHAHPGGIVDMVDEKTENKASVSPVLFFEIPASYSKKVTLEDENGDQVNKDVTYDCGVRVALRWTGGTGKDISGYANGVHCAGKHVDGLRRGLSRGVNEWLNSTSDIMKKNDPTPTIDDITDGLVGVVEVRLEEQCYFTSQTKEILNNAEVLSCVSDAVKDSLVNWLKAKKNSKIAKKIGKSVMESARLRQKQKKEREAAKKVREFQKSTRWPAKLTNCSEYDSPYSELIIVEGDSAANPCRAMRDSRYQAVFPIRGKIKNTFDLALSSKGKSKGVLDNEEASSILKIHQHYKNIIILSDADPDGAHIEILVYTLFYKHMPEVVEEGRIFAVDAPLFVIDTVDGKEQYMAKNDAEKDEILKRLKKEKKEIKYPISRLKGWGECPPELVEETCLNPETRVLRRLTIADMEKAEETLRLAMGRETEPRREWLVNRLDYGDIELFT